MHEFSTIEEAIEEIIKIDNDENLYGSYINQPVFVDNIFPEHLKWTNIKEDLRNAVVSILRNTPVSKKYKYYNYLNSYRMIFVAKFCKKMFGCVKVC
jgi:hypothetical protein